MGSMKTKLILCWIAGLVFSPPFFMLYGEPTKDSTEAPYFWTPSMEEGLDPLPLKSTEVDVRIEGMLATVTVRQVYRNEGSIPVEATYVFPGSTRAAVNDLRFKIGDRKVIAKIQEKEEARRTYETAKEEGKRTVLLEQHRPNVFQMNVANILPADEVTVDLVYTETLPREDGDYEFVYPTVVGPRYAEDPEASPAEATGWVSSPFFAPGTETEAPEFRIRVDMIQGQGISRVGSPSHEVDIQFPEANRASLELIPGEGRSDNRDFVLRYSLAEAEPSVGLLISRVEEGGYFLLNLEPPTRSATRTMVPREYLFLLDTSGSMNGFPLSVSKRIMAEVIGDLGPGDFFNIVAFAGGSEVFSKSGPAAVEPSSKNTAIQWVDRLQGSGGTNLLPALKRVLSLPRTEGTARTVVVLTDGYVTVEKEAFDLIRDSLGEANLFAFGIGSSVNRHLIEGMARAGGGSEYVATSPEEAQRVSAGFIEMVRNPVLTDISIRFDGLEVSEVLPRKQSDLFQERPIRVLGRFSGDWTGRVEVSGLAGEEEFLRSFDLGETPAVEADSIGILWSREKIRELMDDLAFGNEEKIRGQVVELGLGFRLLTRYTSFVAVEELVVRAEGELASVKQPVPLPAGVSAFAVGSGVPASPEPGTVGLILLVAGGLLVLVWRANKRK